jgi:RimJ/RimL family protein N-acetyltransferase
MNKEYLFSSARLGFRGWANDDIAPMATIDTDAEVMRYFPEIPTAEQTAQFIADMQQAQGDAIYSCR